MKEKLIQEIIKELNDCDILMLGAIRNVISRIKKKGQE